MTHYTKEPRTKDGRTRWATIPSRCLGCGRTVHNTVNDSGYCKRCPVPKKAEGGGK